MNMSKELEFYIFLLEQYSSFKNLTADKVLKKWDKAGITNRIFSMYEMYHSESLENAYNDIDRMLSIETALLQL